MTTKRDAKNTRLNMQDSELKGPAPRLETNNSLAKLGLRMAAPLPRSSRFCGREGSGAPAILTRRVCGKLTRRAKLRLNRRANQRYNLTHPFPTRGAYRDRHETRERMRWTRQRRRETVSQGESLVSDCQRAGRTMLMRTAKACGSGTRCWCQIGGGFASSTGRERTFNPPVTVTRRIRRREERAISRKAIAWGMPECFR